MFMFHVHAPGFQLRLASRGVESNISINDVYYILYIYESESIYDSFTVHIETSGVPNPTWYSQPLLKYVFAMAYVFRQK